jgi:hypothetical protein
LPAVNRVSPGTTSGPSTTTASGDGSDSSQEGELEYAFRRAGAVLSRAIGGTLRDVRDAAILGLNEAVRFDLLGSAEESDWFADALNVVLPAMPGGAVLDAALERLGTPATVPVMVPKTQSGDSTSTRSAPAEEVSAVSAGLAALALARPVDRHERRASSRRYLSRW